MHFLALPASFVAVRPRLLAETSSEGYSGNIRGVDGETPWDPKKVDALNLYADV